MKIERLSFIVSPPDKANDFIDADAKIWDRHLQLQKGYIRKTSQVYAGGRVEIQIFWKDATAQKTAEENLDIELIDRQLQLAFPGMYRLLYSN